MTPKILIVDPLTLIGREFLRCLENAPDLAIEVDYRHTSMDDEHQIAELGGAPAQVPPLDDPGEIAAAGVVVITSDVESDRTSHLENLLIRHPETTVVDVARLPWLAELTTPAIGATAATGEALHLRVAHPAFVATASVLTALKHLDPKRGSVAGVDPVSTYGRGALDVLVHQAGRRMQGGDPDQTIDGHILAFNQVAIDADRFTEEAAILFPEIPMAATRTLTGCFHGHVAHISIEFAEPVEDPDLREAFETVADIVVGETPIPLDVVPDRDHVVVTQPILSPDRRVVALTAMVDGLRLGGALTAVDILRTMTVH